MPQNSVRDGNGYFLQKPHARPVRFRKTFCWSRPNYNARMGVILCYLLQLVDRFNGPRKRQSFLGVWLDNHSVYCQRSRRVTAIRAIINCPHNWLRAMEKTFTRFEYKSKYRNSKRKIRLYPWLHPKPRHNWGSSLTWQLSVLQWP